MTVLTLLPAGPMCLAAYATDNTILLRQPSQDQIEASLLVDIRKFNHSSVATINPRPDSRHNSSEEGGVIMRQRTHKVTVADEPWMRPRNKRARAVIMCVWVNYIDMLPIQLASLEHFLAHDFVYLAVTNVFSSTPTCKYI